MALLRWLQPRNGLPDPRGSLSSSKPSQAIAAANREVEAIRTASSGKRAPYGHYSRLFGPKLASTPAIVVQLLFHTPPCFAPPCFAPRVKFSRKAHCAKILLREILSREPFITRKFPDIRYRDSNTVCGQILSYVLWYPMVLRISQFGLQSTRSA